MPLTGQGQAQAQAIGRRIATMVLPAPVAAVVTSPLARCADTAAAVSAAVGDPPVAVEAGLVECDFGEWEGRTFPEVRQRWPDRWRRWQSSTAVAPPGGESLRDVTARVRPVVSSLRSDYPEATVVVVSHVWPLKVMLRDALAASDVFLHRLLLSAGGISVIDSHADGLVAVHSVNDTCHLDELAA